MAGIEDFAPIITAIIGAGASAYGSSQQADAVKKAGSAAGIAGMAPGYGYTPTAQGQTGPPDTGGQSVRQALGFDAQRREVGASGPGEPVKGFTAGAAPLARSPQIGAQAPASPPPPALPQGQTLADVYRPSSPNNLAGGYGNDLTMPPTQQIGAQQKTDTGDAQKYAQYAQLAASLGNTLMRPRGVGAGAGVPQAVGGGYQSTAGQFTRTR